MNKIIAAIAFTFLSHVVVADPCMDADVSPLGYYDTPTEDEAHLEEHGC